MVVKGISKLPIDKKVFQLTHLFSLFKISTMFNKYSFYLIVITQLLISCEKTAVFQPEVPSNKIDQILSTPINALTSAQITQILATPYSALTPDQQKGKFEIEANKMLDEMGTFNTDIELEALQNFENLLNNSTNTIELFTTQNNPSSKKIKTFSVSDIITLNDVYGIYTWDNKNYKWVETVSTSELKFIFPAKDGGLTNNAVLSFNGVSSEIISGEFLLPTSVSATMTIDGKQAILLSATVKYLNKNEVPYEASYKMTIGKMAFDFAGERNLPVSATSSISMNGNNIIKFAVNATTNIDSILSSTNLTKYLGKVNGVVQMMSNFMIVANIDLQGIADAEDKLLLANPNPWDKYTSNNTAFFNSLNLYNKIISEGYAKLYNDNVKLALVSIKDGTKIADIVQRSVKNENGLYYGTTITEQNYNESLYMIFNNSTEVEMSVYFSSGFANIEKRFEDFLLNF